MSDPRIDYVPSDPLRQRIAELRAIGWTVAAISRKLGLEHGMHISRTIAPAKLAGYMATLANPGPTPPLPKTGRMPGTGVGEPTPAYERPTMLPEALDQYDRRAIAERKARRLAELRAENEEKKLANEKRNMEARG